MWYWQRALLAAQQENAEYRAALTQARAALVYYDFANGIPQTAVVAIDVALTKHSPEDEVEQARRMV